MNWFQRHLNWSLVLATIGTYFASFGVGLLFGYTMAPEVVLMSAKDLEGTSILIGIIVGLAILIPISVWFLHRKGRRLGWLGMLFVPFGLIVLLCLRNHRYTE